MRACWTRAARVWISWFGTCREKGTGQPEMPGEMWPKAARDMVERLGKRSSCRWARDLSRGLCKIFGNCGELSRLINTPFHPFPNTPPKPTSERASKPRTWRSIGLHPTRIGSSKSQNAISSLDGQASLTPHSKTPLASVPRNVYHHQDLCSCVLRAVPREERFPEAGNRRHLGDAVTAFYWRSGPSCRTWAGAIG